MAAVNILVRLFSFIFHGLLCLFLLGVSVLALMSRPGSLDLSMLPWSGPTLAYILFFGSLFGLVSLLLAMAAKYRFLFLLWSLAVAVLLLKAFIFSAYRFTTGGFGSAIGMIVASWVALAGAWLQLRHNTGRKAGYKGRY